MRIILICLAVGVLNMTFPSAVTAQQQIQISGVFSGMPWAEFVRTIENTTGFKFYYDMSALDTVVVNTRAEQELLPGILTRIFTDRSFSFSIDSSNRVFVFDKRFTIRTRLPEGFLTGNNLGVDSLYHHPNRSSEHPGNAFAPTPGANEVIEIGVKDNRSGTGPFTLTGYIRDAQNGETLSGATIYLEGSNTGVTADRFGYYTLDLPPGRHTLHISSIGMKEVSPEIILHSDGKLDIQLYTDMPSLKNVTIVSQKNSNVRGLQMGTDRLSIKTIKAVPVLLGEADILKVLLSLPGVTSVGEASSGFNVRGGAADQNLVLYNDATIYNPTHLFGLFSAFNPDITKSVELYKSFVPQRYGGRLSSVLDIHAKTGNTKKWSGTGGIGLLTGKFMIEGPLVKEKTSVILGARSTYSNWLLKQLNNDNFRNSSGSFYDMDLHVSHIADARNSFFLTGYLSTDQFRFNRDTTYRYKNRNLSVKWKHIFSNKMYTTLTTGMDHYDYSVTGEENSVNGYKLAFAIDQFNIRADFRYNPNNKHNIEFGLTSVRYKLRPGSIDPTGKSSLVLPDHVPAEQAFESAIYAGDELAISPKLSFNAGLRYSMYNYLGPHSIYSYADGLPKEEATIVDTSYYRKGSVIKTYHGPEIRLSLRYNLSASASIKLSYNTFRQYIHLLSNTTAISPTDIWKLSDPNIKPQYGEQFSAGFYKNLQANTIETSFEIYYKRLKDYLDYKSGAILILNKHAETEVMNTNGYAYGMEWLVKKNAGKLNGWVSYTYSRVFLKMDDPGAGPLINNGDYYPASFDKPHNLNVILNYRFTHRFSSSFTCVYSTGRPITLPIAVFDMAGGQRVFYSERNQYRVPDYFRTDFSMTIEGNHKVHKATHNSWSFGIYNITAQKNPYSIYFTQENGVIKGYKLSVIGTAIPYITYNIRF